MKTTLITRFESLGAKRTVVPVLLALVALLMCMSTYANTGRSDQPREDTETDVLKTTLARFIEQRTPVTPDQTLHVDVLMPHGTLGACHNPQPFMPNAGGRLRSTITVGLRCPDNQPVTRYFQARIRLEGNYYVAKAPLDTGHVIRTSDLIARRGDLTALSKQLVTTRSALVGQITTRRIGSRLPILENMVKSPDLIARGDEISVIAQGKGFYLTSSGIALNSAGKGDSVRIKTERGTIIRGQATAPQRAVVRF
ncbi:flagellar basal body P-ring formation chaperone FlgA [Larsenimonas suaedae]|uniref:Flagella basal body P-ring formation protein FlgA n=1 Tax=Larsenimonas suaedae TaxID=1851019 RepID=A0ABU1GTM2_9GAMM|nr:flagellar basal body P-ring formation chaperone FlgA [Larsenimonas suaedae]MCM2971628.1 flagellar basal body P-ring formation protein FlgA [Larsenimonas suaedae]MDR5895180.1 flagellar basal body P-ring formation chaperone FlgA [Larsenimonas suaedae]